jgi:hypothetical protein
VVTVQDVREKLNNISDTKVSDETIQININTASVLVNLWKSSASTTGIINETIQAYAALQSYISYIVKLERGIGVIPPGVAMQLDSLTVQFNEARAELLRGNPQAKIPVGLLTSRYTLGSI